MEHCKDGHVAFGDPPACTSAWNVSHPRTLPNQVFKAVMSVCSGSRVMLLMDAKSVRGTPCSLSMVSNLQADGKFSSSMDSTHHTDRVIYSMAAFIVSGDAGIPSMCKLQHGQRDGHCEALGCATMRYDSVAAVASC